mmetsp:Transcript_28997/g.55585  ORF Transcript_28997/g.55585 Transcript_28997/m.55585 type:complete len:236 (-) Transcript_28997:2844-3551(-)
MRTEVSVVLDPSACKLFGKLVVVPLEVVLCQFMLMRLEVDLGHTFAIAKFDRVKSVILQHGALAGLVANGVNVLLRQLDTHCLGKLFHLKLLVLYQCIVCNHVEELFTSLQTCVNMIHLIDVLTCNLLEVQPLEQVEGNPLEGEVGLVHRGVKRQHPPVNTAKVPVDIAAKPHILVFPPEILFHILKATIDLEQLVLAVLSLVKVLRNETGGKREHWQDVEVIAEFFYLVFHIYE